MGLEYLDLVFHPGDEDPGTMPSQVALGRKIVRCVILRILFHGILPRPVQDPLRKDIQVQAPFRLGNSRSTEVPGPYWVQQRLKNPIYRLSHRYPSRSYKVT